MHSGGRGALSEALSCLKEAELAEPLRLGGVDHTTPGQPSHHTRQYLQGRRDTHTHTCSNFKQNPMGHPQLPTTAFLLMSVN